MASLLQATDESVEAGEGLCGQQRREFVEGSDSCLGEPEWRSHLTKLFVHGSGRSVTDDKPRICTRMCRLLSESQEKVVSTRKWQDEALHELTTRARKACFLY